MTGCTAKSKSLGICRIRVQRLSLSMTDLSRQFRYAVMALVGRHQAPHLGHFVEVRLGPEGGLPARVASLVADTSRAANSARHLGSFRSAVPPVQYTQPSVLQNCRRRIHDGHNTQDQSPTAPGSQGSFYKSG